MLKNLKNRSQQPELMDDFKEGMKALRAVYDDINRVNSVLGGNSITIKAISKLMREHPRQTYSIVDMGCGDGAMLREVAQFTRKNNIKVKLIGIDLNADVIQLAREASLAYPEISFLQKDILHLSVSDLHCDIIISTLAMHHFAHEDIVSFLRKFNQLARIAVVINDLQRSLWAYYLFKLYSLIFIRTRTAKVDGLISISKGFIKPELQHYATLFPEYHHKIKWKWAFRYVWVMKSKRLKINE